MAIRFPYTTYSTSFVSTEHDDNRDAVASKFGNIVNSDIRSGANIDVDKLSANLQEIWVVLTYHENINGAAWPAVGATTPLAVVPLPGSDADTAWTATDVSWVCSDTGTTAGSFDVRYGAYSAGVWANAGSVITAVSMPVVGAGNLPNQGRGLEGGSITITQSSTVRALALMSAGQGAAVMNGGTDWLRVTVALQRKMF